MTKRLSHKQVTSRGGKATYAKYGSEHMSNIAKRSMKGKKLDPDYFKNLARKSVESREAKKRALEAKIGVLTSD